jgi:hypothetical protein
MKRAIVVTGFVALLVAVSRAGAQTQAASSPTGTVACLNAARAKAESAIQKGASAEAARLQLEIDSASCFDPSLTPAGAHLVGTVNADRARFARDFLAGKLTLRAYRAAMEDRRRKLARLMKDPKGQAALLTGDADGDLVPDDVDQCPGTPPDTPTDDRGCPRKVPPKPGDAEQERQLRDVLAGARYLYSKSCEDAPRPQIPMPLEWGRGAQTKLGRMGFNLAVTKVTPAPADCEIFYEIEIRFSDASLGNPAIPPSKILTLVYSNREDLLNDPRRAVFGLPIGVPLSPARTEALEAFMRQYMRATWRVRAVNGSNLPSPWSPFVTQGPASSGVPG